MLDYIQQVSILNMKHDLLEAHATGDSQELILLIIPFKFAHSQIRFHHVCLLSTVGEEASCRLKLYSGLSPSLEAIKIRNDPAKPMG